MKRTDDKWAGSAQTRSPLVNTSGHIQGLNHSSPSSYSSVLTLQPRFSNFTSTEYECSTIGKEIVQTNLIHLAFNHRNKQRLRCAVWFAVKTMYRIYTSRIFNKVQLLRELIKEIDWNLKLNRKLGSRQDLLDLRSLIELQR